MRVSKNRQFLRNPLSTPDEVNTISSSKQRFDNLEQLADGVRHWDVEFRPLASDTSGTDLIQVQLGPIMITHLSTGCRHFHQGASPPGMYTFAFLADGNQMVRWCGTLLDAARIPFFAPAQDFTASASPRFSVFTLSVDTAWLQQTAVWERFDVEPGRRKLARAQNPRAVSRLRGTVSEACGLLVSTPLTMETGAQFVSTITTDVISDLINVIGDGAPILETVPAAARARAVRRAIAYMRENPSEALSVDEISKVAKVSERTLQRSFLEHFGVTPKAFFQGIRLTGVRDELLRHAPSEMLVRDAASRWGFWHLGQFARDYRQLFGELPSQTLASGHRVSNKR